MKPKKHLSFSSLRKKVSEVFNAIPDWRKKSQVTISIHDAMMSGFACMHFQDESLLQFQKHLEDKKHQNNLRTMFDVQVIPKSTQMREIIDNVDSKYFREIFRDIYSRLQRGKHLEQYQIFPKMYYFPIDGSQFHSSNDIHCENCLTKELKNGTINYSHQVLQGGIMHPNCSEVIPFMPEHITNTDGNTKQDCEMNAAKRFIDKIHKEFPQLGILLGGDALFSKQPIIEHALNNKMHILFAAKPDDHKHMMEYLSHVMLSRIKFIDSKERIHIYEWVNTVPLNGNKQTISINYLKCTIMGKNKQNDNEILYKNSWVTDLTITEANIKTLVAAGRCRWKNENEVFNVMKTHGYCMEHNYGHGDKHLALNFYLLTLLAFLFHQIFELTDKLYQASRKKFGSKWNMWNILRSYIRIIVFGSWELLLQFALNPDHPDFDIPPILNTG